jgi:hypothetical protein
MKNLICIFLWMIVSGIGPYVEVAFYHKPSRTLLVTDAVIFVPRQPPECISKESLLASAKNGLAVKILSKGKEVSDEPVVDNKRNRQKGLFFSFPTRANHVVIRVQNVIKPAGYVLQDGKEWFCKSCFLVHRIF